jgi:hypothetical protein
VIKTESIEKPELDTAKLAAQIGVLRNILLRHSLTNPILAAPVAPQSENEISSLEHFDIDFHTPKRRVKRFTCWHSCLGPWKKKNPRTNGYKYSLDNTLTSDPSTTAPKEKTASGEDVIEEEVDDAVVPTETSTTKKPSSSSENDDTGDDEDKNNDKKEAEETDDGNIL